jgi:hypothetical protein
MGVEGEVVMLLVIGKADSTLFTKKMGKDLFICQIYV